ncbi:hypothetical protein HCN44_009993 [Aphidius gifuensis]|uniref:Uncharacterized protein n=1 Tax=Aphidius gifuensis TaxID=684658 RepID=A0A834Y3K6_APHGI|nr:hypothetical protein HCN44_009993 [Aphidius gifuensis]
MYISTGKKMCMRRCHSMVLTYVVDDDENEIIKIIDRIKAKELPAINTLTLLVALVTNSLHDKVKESNIKLIIIDSIASGFRGALKTVKEARDKQPQIIKTIANS